MLWRESILPGDPLGKGMSHFIFQLAFAKNGR
jgi:hypothetical protein